jgi:hypothetical protein
MNRSPSHQQPDIFMWGDTLKPEACQTPGLIITDDCSTCQVSRAAKRTGRLSSLGKCLKNRLHIETKYASLTRSSDRVSTAMHGVWAPWAKRNHPTENRRWKATQAGIARRLGTSTGHLKSMCVPPTCCTWTRGARLRSDNEAAHLRLSTGYSTAKTTVARKVMESLPADHPWMRRVQR